MEPQALGVAPDQDQDFRTLFAGTAQNIVGLVVFVLGSIGANVVVARAFGDRGGVALALVTLGTQFAFIAAAGARFGMDMAAIRYVAIEVGADRRGRIRGIVVRAFAIAAAVSVPVAALMLGVAPWLASQLSDEAAAVGVLRAAALALPFIAVTFVWLGASRGLKIMRHTLYVQWVGQPLLWIVLMLGFWTVSKTVEASVLAYAASWVVAAVMARALWGGTSRASGREPLDEGFTGTLVRYGAPRAPAALFSQGLFWIDFFVAAAYTARGEISAGQLGVYAACVRISLAMVLFMTAVAYVFSPFVADLHSRGERERLDALFKTITRWTVAGTIPILLLMLVAPASLLRLFGGQDFAGGADTLRILLIGQVVNVSVGAAGFVLIMAGRTGWDLFVYVSSAALDLALAIFLVPRLGIDGAAVAQSVTLAASNALRLWLVWRFVRIEPWDRRYARLAVPAVIGAAVMVAAHAVVPEAKWFLNLTVTALVGGAAYAAALLAVGLPDTERAAAFRFAGKLARRR